MPRRQVDVAQAVSELLAAPSRPHGLAVLRPEHVREAVQEDVLEAD